MNTAVLCCHISSMAPGEEADSQPRALTKTISEEQPDQLCRITDPSHETREDFGKHDLSNMLFLSLEVVGMPGTPVLCVMCFDGTLDMSRCTSQAHVVGD